MRKFNTKLSKNGSSVHISLMSRNICIPIVAVFFLYLSLVFFAHHWSRSLGRLLVSLSLSWFYSLSCSLPDGMRCLESLNLVDASKMHWCILTSQSLINFTTILQKFGYHTNLQKGEHHFGDWWIVFLVVTEICLWLYRWWVDF